MPERRLTPEQAAAIQAALHPPPAGEQLYRAASDKLQGSLSAARGYNPAATNYSYRLINPGTNNQTLNQVFGALTNLPNTLVFDAHGGTNLSSDSRFRNNPQGHLGFSLNTNDTSQLAQDLKARKDLIYSNPDAAKAADAFGGMSLSDIAQNLKGATNDIKRAVILSCFRGGYNPAEIKKYFPNVEQIITSAPDSSTGPGYAASMFQEKPDKFFQENPSPAKYPGEDWTLRSYTPNSTNKIYSIKDWIDSLPQGIKPLPSYQ